MVRIWLRGQKRFGAMAMITTVLLLVDVAASEAQRAFLQLVVNQVERGMVIVLLREKDILVRIRDLEQADLRGFLGRREPIGEEIYVSLASLSPGITFELDEEALALRLTAQPQFFAPTVLRLQPGPPPGLIYSQESSAFLNYSVSVLDFDRYTAFGEGGVSVGQHLLFSSLSRTPDAGLVRGLSNYSFDDRQRLTRWVAGDSFADSGSLGASLVMGGINVLREFSLAPYFVRYPTVGVAGAVLTPSTADVYIDNLLVRREPLPPGTFELRNLPVPPGSGAVRVVLRDAFGRTQEIATPFYFTTALLAPGIHDFNYSLGFPREHLDTSSGDYGSLAFLGRHRLGITDGLTAGLRLELSGTLASGGPTLTARLPWGWGEMEATGAASREGTRGGQAASLAYNFPGRPLSFGGLLKLQDRHYATLSLRAADDRARLEASAFIGVQVGPRASLTLQATRSDMRDGERLLRASAFASVRLTERANLVLNVSHTRLTGDTTTSGAGTTSGSTSEAFVSLIYFFGNSTTGSASYDQRGSARSGIVDVEKPLPVGTGFGYRVHASRDDGQDLAAGTLQYQGPYGRYEATYEHAEGKGATALSAAGGVIAIGGAVYPTRPIQEGFALIRTPGLGGVRAYANNQEIGQTNSRGDVPVPNLLAYYGNRLAIRDEDIPLDYRVDIIEKTVAPPFRGGALVTFPVQRIQSLIGFILLEVSGQIMTPAYGQLSVTADGKRFESPIGKQGEFYLENVPAGQHSATLEYGERLCQFTLRVPASDERVVNLGTLRCVIDGG